MIRKARNTLFSVLVLNLLFCGTVVGAEYTLTDALGRSVTLDNPQRVVALMGGFAETWLLAGGELVGVTTDAATERGLNLGPDVTVVGAYNSPNTEAILSLDPDLVILSSETSAHVALRDLFEGAGIPAVYFRVNYFEDYLAMLADCCAITGRPERYQEYGAEILAAVDAVRGQPQPEPKPRALLMITYSGGAAVQDSTTMTGRMLKEMGWENLADLNPGIRTQFNVEFIMEADPDYIFVIAMGNDEDLARKNLAQTLEAHPAWAGLNAVQNGRYLLLPKELFLYKPNARWAESYAFLKSVLENS